MKNALIMIDYINDIVHPQGKIASSAKMIIENNIINKCNKALNYARKNSWLVIWVKVAFSSNYIELGNSSSPIFTEAKKQQALIKDTWGTEILEGLNYQDDELIIIKNRISPFYKTNLELVLTSNAINQIYIAGVSTQWAIEATVREAHDRNFAITVIEDLCASGALEFHNASLKIIAKVAKLITSEELSDKI